MIAQTTQQKEDAKKREELKNITPEQIWEYLQLHLYKSKWKIQPYKYNVPDMYLYCSYGDLFYHDISWDLLPEHKQHLRFLPTIAVYKEMGIFWGDYYWLEVEIGRGEYRKIKNSAEIAKKIYDYC